MIQDAFQWMHWPSHVGDPMVQTASSVSATLEGECSVLDDICLIIP